MREGAKKMSRGKQRITGEKGRHKRKGGNKVQLVLSGKIKCMTDEMKCKRRN